MRCRIGCLIFSKVFVIGLAVMWESDEINNHGVYARLIVTTP